MMIGMNGRDRLAFDAPSDLETIDLREHDIQENEIREWGPIRQRRVECTDRHQVLLLRPVRLT